VSADEKPGVHGVSTAVPQSPRGGRRHMTAITIAVVLTVLIAATARLFIWPAQGMPARADAIVMLDSPDGDPLGTALRLVDQDRAPYLVVSLGSPLSATYRCPRPPSRVTVICFNPTPATTQGEAEFIGRLARKYHWRSISLVTMTPQDSRARLRVERCFAGRVYVITAPIPLTSWPYQVVYQWGAIVKALIIQRGC
jgi:hypothetical protein